jgi:hypothetical protein
MIAALTGSLWVMTHGNDSADFGHKSIGLMTGCHATDPKRCIPVIFIAPSDRSPQ